MILIDRSILADLSNFYVLRKVSVIPQQLAVLDFLITVSAEHVQVFQVAQRIAVDTTNPEDFGVHRDQEQGVLDNASNGAMDKRAMR